VMTKDEILRQPRNVLHGKVTTYTKKCEYCGKEFTKRTSNLLEPMYCNHDCASKAMIKEKTLTQFTCEHCKKPFERYVAPSMHSPKYCSRACSTIARPHTQYLKTYTCPNCKNDFQRLVSTNPFARVREPTFCSHACRVEFTNKSVQVCLRKRRGDSG